MVNWLRRANLSERAKVKGMFITHCPIKSLLFSLLHVKMPVIAIAITKMPETVPVSVALEPSGISRATVSPNRDAQHLQFTPSGRGRPG